MKICLAGTGAMGEIHVKALDKIDDVEVAAIASRVEDSGKALRRNGTFHSTPRTWRPASTVPVSTRSS